MRPSERDMSPTTEQILLVQNVNFEKHLLDLNKIQHLIHAEGIKWTFNPPYGPHHRGVLERLIQTVKKILYSTKEQTMDDESLQTALCEVEAIINDCRIKVVTQHRDRTQLQDTGGRYRSLVQYISELFWKCWTREYLPLMQERQKWNEGHITDTFPDKKGHVRRIKIKTQNGTLERPITKLCLLKDMT
ncbi:hypothetical protein N1851_030192 [Merluccius polli]|uniref:Integrase catalytic domain-containing protein n=1 Tax=Merluccius polli TaxID=89951 RepID=A0AA47NQ99_MERPO|nr:hypothetical protein N1851_030192 [Merluccius polli]